MSKLSGKLILFLGSSVTFGAASGGISFVDELALRTGCSVVKEAVSGTTMADIDDGSYVSRLQRMDPSLPADLFVCQLSTNDASRGLPLGSPVQGDGEYDKKTVSGAIVSIAAHVRETWHCPVVFYTSPRYESDGYAAMVGLLKQLQKKWRFGIIDLWNDEAFNQIGQAHQARWMQDPIHPTLEGYREWWTPEFQRRLEEYVQ